MDEPLFDSMSAAAVILGVIALVTLKASQRATDSLNHARMLGLVGHVALGLSVSLLLLRWGQGFFSLPTDQRPSEWRAGLLMLFCGLGVGIAMRLLIVSDPRIRAWHFAMLVGCVEVALLLASAWKWMLLVLVIVTAVAWWSAKRRTWLAAPHAAATMEPALVAALSAALLLLVFGTWDHVLDRETQRKTRSPRYSAWPRLTALQDAWQRTNWTIKSSDPDSEAAVTKSASREQRIAWGLAALTIVFVTALKPVSRLSQIDMPAIADQETPHVS